MRAARDMKSTSGKTRMERRAEQHQIIIWGLMVLVIGILCFALGFVVGRRGTSEPVAVEQISAPQPIPPMETPVAPVAQAPTPAVPLVEEPLTFYENLSKAETTPVGSGINLPPTAADSEEGAANKIDPKPQTAPVKIENSEVTPAPKRPLDQVMANLVQPEPTNELQLPPVSTHGGWVVQLFASKSAADAGILRDKLAAKDYPVFIAEADLGSKGLWYRVSMGPFASRDIALQAQAFAEKRDNMKGFTRQR